MHVWGRPVLDRAAANPAAARRPTRRRIRGGVRTAGGRAARGHAASTTSAGGQGRDRPQAIHVQRAEKDRRRDLGLPEERGRRAGGGRTSTNLRLAYIAFDFENAAGNRARPRARSMSPSRRSAACDAGLRRQAPVLIMSPCHAYSQRFSARRVRSQHGLLRRPTCLRAAIFDFELIDTSLEGATIGPRADETARLARLGDQLRRLVTNSGKLEVIDIAPVRAEAHQTNLQACGGCDADLAQKLGAELAITGTGSRFQPDPQHQSLCPCRCNPSAAGCDECGYPGQHRRFLVARARISRTHAVSPAGDRSPAIAAFAAVEMTKGCSLVIESERASFSCLNLVALHGVPTSRSAACEGGQSQRVARMRAR